MLTQYIKNLNINALGYTSNAHRYQTWLLNSFNVKIFLELFAQLLAFSCFHNKYVE